MHITPGAVQAWLEETKLSVTSLDAELEDQISSTVLARLDSTFDVTTWTNEIQTPKLVQSIIAMLYAAWVYDRAYGDNAEQPNAYATLLRQTAMNNIQGLLSGVIVLPAPNTLPEGTSSPVFFPTDLSSATESTVDDPADGPAAFSMGMPF